MKASKLWWLMITVLSWECFSATIRNNNVAFKCPWIHDFKCQDVSFVATSNSVSQGQPFEGISYSIDSDGNLVILVKAGRHKTPEVANWFNPQCSFGMISQGSARDSTPAKLNFGISGILKIQGISYNIVLGQGHSDITLRNNWWLGGIDLHGTYMGGSVTTYDGLFTIASLNPAEFEIIENRQNVNWIGEKVLDSTTLNAMSIPGTHNSGTFGVRNPLVGDNVITQRLSIIQQLLIGVRAIDIRCTGSSMDGGSFGVFYGNIYCNLRFDDVLDNCTDFLKKYPREFIVLIISREDINNDDEDAPSFERIFNKYVQKYGADKFWLKNRIPKVREVRGKIVIINRGDISSGIFIEWQENRAFTSQFYNNFKVQDYFDCPLSKKINSIEVAFNDAFSDTENEWWFINFLSGYNMIPYPLQRAKKINPKVRDFLLESKSGKTGIVFIDFAGDFGSSEMINNIIDRN